MFFPKATILALTAALATAVALAPPPARAAGKFVLKSVSVELPMGTLLFPGGKMADAINANCVACHSTGMVRNQPPMSKAGWSAEVHKMINVYKAPVDPAAIDSIVDYLVNTKGGN